MIRLNVGRLESSSNFKLYDNKFLYYIWKSVSQSKCGESFFQETNSQLSKSPQIKKIVFSDIKKVQVRMNIFK